MKMIRVSFLLLGGAMLLPLDSFAQSNKKNNRRVVPLTRKGAAAELPTIKKVGGDSVTIGRKTYKVTSFTRILVDGKRATLGQLRPGMQVSVAGGVLRYGKGEADTVYKATRITAKADNKLEEKRREFNKKQAERARELNRRNNRKRR
ncbi:MAG: hypothetical protein CMP28_12770 [Roseibacillus sp.]|nr:hypothetical protein [Roseibacillus sp.]